jgi:hypothetical protein
MDVEISARPGYLSVSVAERGSPDESRALLQKLLGIVHDGEHRRVLISVRRSHAIFKVEEYGLSEVLARAAGFPGLRVAMVADTSELFASYQYVELLAAQKGLTAKAFRSEADALRWLFRAT